MKSFQEEFAVIKQICESDDFIKENSQMKERLSSRPVVLYGAGDVGISTAKALWHYGIEPVCFCDKRLSGVQKETGIKIISPQMLKFNYSDANIIICSVRYFDEICNDLAVLGYSSTQIFSRVFLNLHEMSYESIMPHLPGYECAYDSFEDDNSKQILMWRLNCYLTSCPVKLRSPPPQYFDPEIMTLTDKEIFVDGGMYTGDTAELFFQSTNGKYIHYYGFEPDDEIYRIANENLSKVQNKTLNNKGLWSKQESLGFLYGQRGASKVYIESGRFAEVISLDGFFSDKEPPTFIKMDIEGAELEAVKGSLGIIQQYKPKLAICVYHKPEDIYTLPQQIKRVRPDYKLYLRHYSNTLAETVLYGI